MRQRWRVLLIIAEERARGLSLASSEVAGAPPRDPALLAAQLMRAGAEVKVVDQGTEHVGARTLAREARHWEADLVLVHAGGHALANDPVPDAKALSSLLAAWSASAPVVATGPLAVRYGDELLATLPRLAGVLEGGAGEELVGRWEPEAVPGLRTRDGSGPAPTAGDETLLPAWNCLPLEQYATRGAQSLPVATLGRWGGEPGPILDEVRHAVQRAGARFLFFDARDLGSDPDLARELSRSLLGAAPNVHWACRLSAASVDPSFVLTLAQGACEEVLIVPEAPADAPAQAPMDDPERPTLEAAIEAARVAGLTAYVEHVVGRPGHTASSLSGWQEWFKVRQVAVRPRVRVVHAGERGPGEPTLAEAWERAGRWDNELSPRDVEKAVRRLGGGGEVPVGMAG